MCFFFLFFFFEAIPSVLFLGNLQNGGHHVLLTRVFGYYVFLKQRHTKPVAVWSNLAGVPKSDELGSINLDYRRSAATKPQTPPPPPPPQKPNACKSSLRNFPASTWKATVRPSLTPQNWVPRPSSKPLELCWAKWECMSFASRPPPKKKKGEKKEGGGGEKEGKKTARRFHRRKASPHLGAVHLDEAGAVEAPEVQHKGGEHGARGGAVCQPQDPGVVQRLLFFCFCLVLGARRGGEAHVCVGGEKIREK